jgi:hypothetical protein
MVFIKGIKAPLIHVTKPKIKNSPAIIIIGTNVLFFGRDVSNAFLAIFLVVYKSILFLLI